MGMARKVLVPWAMVMCLVCNKHILTIPTMCVKHILRFTVLLPCGHIMCFMGDMADKDTLADKVRVPLLLSPEEAKELDDWQFQHRHRTRTAALKALMKLGYEATATPAKGKPSSM